MRLKAIWRRGSADETYSHLYYRAEASRSALPLARAGPQPELGLESRHHRLCRRLDSDLWETSGHNPVMMLGRIEQRLLEETAADDSFLAHPERVCRTFDDYV
jgi:hypothetical protein